MTGFETEEYRDFAVGLAQQAGKELASHFRKDRELLASRRTVKGIVTRYDEEVDRIMRNAILKNFPSHNILTEEGGATNKGSEYTWVVDPLDGTVNFASGNPLFCVTLALLKEGDPILGVTCAPWIDELFFAEKGEGAFLNGERVSVSRKENLDECYAYYCEGGEPNRSRTGRVICALHPSVKDLRKLGSAGLESAWTACSRGDAYVSVKIEPWDVAAGVLLVREAGGKVTDFKGLPWKPERSDLVFSNGRVHDEVLELVVDL